MVDPYIFIDGLDLLQRPYGTNFKNNKIEHSLPRKRAAWGPADSKEAAKQAKKSAGRIRTGAISTGWSMGVVQAVLAKQKKAAT